MGLRYRPERWDVAVSYSGFCGRVSRSCSSPELQVMAHDPAEQLLAKGALQCYFSAKQGEDKCDVVYAVLFSWNIWQGRRKDLGESGVLGGLTDHTL